MTFSDYAPVHLSWLRCLGLWSFTAILAMALAQTPAAADELKFQLKQEGNTLTCTSTGTVQVQAQPLVKVITVGIPESATIDIDAEVDGTSTKLTQDATDKTLWLATVITSKPSDIKVQAKVSGVNGNLPVACGTPIPSPVIQPNRDDVEAQMWLLGGDGSRALKEFENNKDYPKTTKFLVHLPSGATASPFPESVSEDTFLQALVVQCRESAVPYAVQIVKCAKRVEFRVSGTAADFKAPSERKGLELCKERVLLPAGQPFRCAADEAAYIIHPSGSIVQAPETTLRIRPVYQLATTFTYGFDFSHETTFSVEDEKIAAAEDKIGPGLRIGFTWYPWGLDPEQPGVLNHFLNPFAVFDPKAPTENFIIGTSITRRGGISLAIGAAFHKRTVLKGKAVGDPFTGDGDVPTRKEWKDMANPGLFVGIAMDSNVFKLLGDFFK